MGWRHWLWVPSLFWAGEIPVTLITFVALLMFLQTGASPALATLCCGCLFLPWALGALLKGKLAALSRYRRQIQLAELAMVVALMLLALSFTWRGFSPLWLFALLLLLSLLCAWHQFASRRYFLSALRQQERRLWRRIAMFFSQVSAILTYGLALMLVGALQVLWRSIRLAWAQGCYIAAGVLLLFTLWHLFSLPAAGDVSPSPSRGGRHRLLALLSLFLLLLPQGLMFFSRVLFLFTPVSSGGLGCTLQEIAFAQGAVGVIGFSLGLAVGGGLYRERLFWAMAVSLCLSPCVYVFMVALPPRSLLRLSLCTFTAQLLFGFGLPACRQFLCHLGGGSRGGHAAHTYIPFVSAAMFLPCALSGWLVGALGFGAFFAVDASLALLSWLLLWLTGARRKCHEC
ncbi:MAG: hypothetical protein LUC33_01240 [Prevotellaceae bacterium]|nr:hypothetical protein [Prevotellaceae bacterium]